MKAKVEIPSMLKCDKRDQALRNYEDKIICSYLRYGWPSSYSADRPPMPTYKNHATAENFKTHIDNFLETELDHKAMIGPFKSPPFKPWTQISPMLTRAKKDSTKRPQLPKRKWRERKSPQESVTGKHPRIQPPHDQHPYE